MLERFTVRAMEGLSPLIRRIRGLRPWVADGVLALALLVPTASSAVGDGETARDPWWLVVPLVLLTVLPIAVRRYWPLQVFVVMLASAVVLDLAWHTFPAVGPIVGLYTVATQCERRRAVAAGAIAAVGIAVALIGERPSNLLAGIAAYALFAAAWILGDNLRVRRAYLSELEERAARLEREREQNARRAVADEQARIARELHDVIAHNVSVMVVQAAAAGEVFDTQPKRAREALSSIETTGREALAELRRLLGAVDSSRTPSQLAPQPGLDRLESLIEGVRSAGLRAELTVHGARRDLPAGIDLAAYRVVQEALTNTLKHARAGRVAVAVEYGVDALSVDVSDDGVGAAAAADELGRGIIGMRERVALYGGDLSVRSDPAGGFRVSARFPLIRDAA